MIFPVAVIGKSFANSMMRAEGMAAYHAQTREVLSVPNPAFNDVMQGWHQTFGVDERIAVAGELRQTEFSKLVLPPRAC